MLWITLNRDAVAGAHWLFMAPAPLQRLRFYLVYRLASWPMKLAGTYIPSPFLQLGSYAAGNKPRDMVSDAALPEAIADCWSLPCAWHSAQPFSSAASAAHGQPLACVCLSRGGLETNSTT